MGKSSYLLFVPTSIAKTQINWTRIPTSTKKLFLKGWGDDRYPDMPLPPTVADLAEKLDGSKFFGYFYVDLCMLLMDISEFGFRKTPGLLGPRFYMKYLDRVWFLLFTPGKRDCIVGYSHHLDKDDEDEEIFLAEEFDVRLEQEVLGGMASSVHDTKKLGGWKASVVTMTLP